MAKICVFCSSTDELNQDYIDTAIKMGQLMGEQGHHLIYGGSHLGLMGELSREFAEHSEEITEIIPKIFEHVAVKKHNCIVTENFGERLRNMQELSDAFIVLPGGFGSIHELIDVLVAKQIRLHNKPLVVVNTNNLYTPIIEQVKKIIDEGLAPKDNLPFLHVVDTPEEALDYIKNYEPAEVKDKLGS
ncbi:TIGR00730 family Rossman fold protein [archaeon]|jgi:cytokinin riboside 5'-monophosphate phosphoribohydrolase|nr:TIGR00730 family Rossman fold protein [archaeon]MBT3577919.1 TIGR00730 family Rossman fold protein [archaeon]MBT6820522.1 TIGR00730 family Rossman fold protein [archaeon]MBT6956626.1 TIGR00730 family Rossman fold protein [archaeon]MBT7025772.1 TIGR00730 family Rossman fold protein [archaeon]